MDSEPEKPATPKDSSSMTRLLNAGAAPIEAAIEKTSPGFQEKLSRRLEEILKRSIEQMMSTFDEADLEQRLAQARAVDSEGRQGWSEEQFESARAQVKGLRKDARQKTVVGSAVTGTMGFVGQLADLPAFYLYAIKTLGDIAIHYGFDPRSEREQLFILQLLRIGHVPGKRNRLAELDALTQIELDREQNLIHEASYALSGRGLAVASKQIARLLVKRKLGSMIPLVGAVVNAGVNWHLMGVLLDTADRGYQSKATLYRNRVNSDPA